MSIVAEASVRCRSFIESAREPHERGHLVRLFLQNRRDDIPKETETLLILAGKDRFVYINAIVLHVEDVNGITRIVATAEQVPNTVPSLQTLTPQRLT